MTGELTFWGYERPDGSVGIRNLVAVISVMDNCNPVSRAIVSAVKGTVYLPGSFIRGQLGRDRQITLDVSAGLCNNPNIAAVVAIGLEPRTTEELTDLVKKSGKPVVGIDMQLVGGTIMSIAEGTKAAMRFAREASRQQRKQFPVSRLHVGLECGGSDTTSGLASNPSIGVVADAIVAAGGIATITETSEFFGAEAIFARRGATPQVSQQILDTVRNHEKDIVAMGIDLRGSNPSFDNIRGGLTTIEEKALGAISKSGSAPVVGVLAYGEVPKQPGLHFMAGPAPAVESITGLASGGCQITLFSTGVGNPIGNPVSTCIKVSGNRNTLNSMPDNVDFDVSGVLEKDEPIKSAGERLLQYMLSVCNGELTTSELLDTRESAISRFGISM